MKKAKNLLLVAIFAICSFILVGEVNAAATASVSSFQLVCTPDNVENGATTKCYLVANIENSDSGEGLYGVVTHNSFHNLTLENVESLISGVNAAKLSNGQSTMVSTANIQYTCNKTTGCSVFYSNGAVESDDPNTAAPNGSQAGLIKKGSSQAISGGGFDGTNYTAIGAYTVKLSEDATTAECGQMCVDVFYALKSTEFVHDAASGDSLRSAGSTVCDEVKPSGKGTELPTGSFTSYIVLAAGALIAVGAIVVAKKNTKFNRI